MVDGKVLGGEGGVEVEEGEKKKGNGFLPYVLGMQLLTNAIYLPYLVVRKKAWNPREERREGYELSKAEKFGESKIPPLVFTAIGMLALAWAGLARGEVYGMEFSERWGTFVEILGKDRLTFSFVVDLIYFWAFQGWLMGDDLKRRVGGREGGGLGLAVCKAVPFLGLAAYLVTRPALLPAGGGEEEEG
jgi:hypothetical protein